MEKKKSYFILSPYERTLDLMEKAASYYGNKDYQFVNEDKEFQDLINAAISQNEGQFNTHLALIGSSLLAMSFCDSIYVAKGWEEIDYCKICHALAFSHGLEIVYES